jgi:hypothetical protein
LRVLSLVQDDCPNIVECWYFVLLPLPLSKLQLLNYSDVTQAFIAITLLFVLVMYVIYYTLLLC